MAISHYILVKYDDQGEPYLDMGYSNTSSKGRPRIFRRLKDALNYAEKHKAFVVELLIPERKMRMFPSELRADWVN